MEEKKAEVASFKVDESSTKAKPSAAMRENRQTSIAILTMLTVLSLLVAIVAFALSISSFVSANILTQFQLQSRDQSAIDSTTMEVTTALPPQDTTVLMNLYENCTQDTSTCGVSMLSLYVEMCLTAALPREVEVSKHCTVAHTAVFWYLAKHLILP